MFKKGFKGRLLRDVESFLSLYKGEVTSNLFVELSAKVEEQKADLVLVLSHIFVVHLDAGDFSQTGHSVHLVLTLHHEILD